MKTKVFGSSSENFNIKATTFDGTEDVLVITPKHPTEEEMLKTKDFLLNELDEHDALDEYELLLSGKQQIQEQPSEIIQETPKEEEKEIPKENTLIQVAIRKELKNKLDAAKVIKRESYSSVIQRIFDEWEQQRR